ncbi:MAG: DUF4131 domain-containing protein [Proteobacteria bacterium]|nr:DUF4131 domain-containing protein [Pseudomonadota bacterium]
MAAVLPSSEGVLGLLIGAVVSLLFAACVAWLRMQTVAKALLLLATVLAGWGFAAWRAELRLADSLPMALEGQDVTVTGVVAGLPQDFERGLRFTFRVEGGMEGVPEMLSLAWYKGFRDDEWHTLPALHAGERWRLTVRLKRPHGNVNPHGFDYEGWLLEQGIRATGYVRPDRANQRLDAFVPGIMSLVERSREHIRARFQEALPEAEYRGVLVALAIGDQRAISHVD